MPDEVNEVKWQAPSPPLMIPAFRLTDWQDVRTKHPFSWESTRICKTTQTYGLPKSQSGPSLSCLVPPALPPPLPSSPRISLPPSLPISRVCTSKRTVVISNLQSRCSFLTVDEQRLGFSQICYKSLRVCIWTFWMCGRMYVCIEIGQCARIQIVAIIWTG